MGLRLVLQDFICSKCGRPLFFSEAELTANAPRCPACPLKDVLITEEDIKTALEEVSEVLSTDAFRRWQDETERAEAERQGDPVAVRSEADAAEEAHNRQLAEGCPPGWSLVALYDDQRDERGWLYKKPTGLFRVQAPGELGAIIDLENFQTVLPGWDVKREWFQVCYKYTITAPNQEEMIFFDSWNA